MRRFAGGLFIVLFAASAAAPPAAAGPREDYDARRSQAPNVLRPPDLLGHQWRGDPPYVAGVGVVSRGEFIYQDRPFDDTGADTVPDTEEAALQTAYPGLCAANSTYRHGEYAYPADDPAYRRNGADLVELRVARDGDDYAFLFQLQTLLDPAKAAARLTVNGDHELLVRAGTATLNGDPVAYAADAAANTLEARVPASALPGGVWTLTATTGVPTSAGTTWVDAAFVEEVIVDQFNCWQDKAQAAHFAAGTLPTASVDTARLAAGASDPPVVRRGAMVRLHAPYFDNGEGVEAEPTFNQQSTAAIYRGKLEPYSAYVPESYQPGVPAPLLVVLHCLNCNHNTFHTAAWPGLKELADGLGAIVVTPLAYGEGRHYEEEAELDVFEVLTDVSQRYSVDSERLLLSGMSMGALGTFRLGLLYPDVWARTLGIGNYTSPYCVSVSADACSGINYTTLLENARNLPWGLLNGVLDELTPVTLSRDYAARFTSMGYAHRLWQYAAARHSPSLHGETVDASVPWLQGARRVTDPARVTYVVDRSLFNQKYGISYDRAYWVTGMRLADGVNRGKVDATSGRGTVIGTEAVSGSGSSAAGPYTMSGLDPVLSKASDGNRLDVAVEGVASLRVDPVAAGLSVSEPLQVVVDSASPVVVEVLGMGTVRSPGSGQTAVVLQPAGDDAPRASNGGGPHPATGGPDTAHALWLPILALVIRRFRRAPRHPR